MMDESSQNQETYGTPPEETFSDTVIHAGYVERVLGTKLQALQAHDRLNPPSMLVCLCEHHFRLSNIKGMPTFFSLALKMWCLLYTIMMSCRSNMVRSELGNLLELLAALAYHGGNFLSISGRKLALDVRSGTSLCLPGNGQYVVDTYSDARSMFLSKVSDVIARFGELSVYDGPYAKIDILTVHYTADEAWKDIQSLFPHGYSGSFDFNGITVFNPDGICPDLKSLIKSLDNLLRPFNVFAEHVNSSDDDNDDVDDHEAGFGRAPSGFQWDSAPGTPRLVPVENMSDYFE
jgi:hypothetical protein